MISAVLLLSLTACGKGDDAKSSLPPSSSSEPLTDADKYEHLRGTKLIYYNWNNPWMATDGLYAEALKEKYDITIEQVLVGKDEYIKTVKAAIASKIPVDMLYGRGLFPDILTVLQPLENSGIDLTDPALCRPLLEATSVNGKPYLMDRESNSEKYYSLCVYNKSLFEDAGIPTPKEYFDKGEWTFENFIYSAEKIAAMGKDYTGAGILPETGPTLFGDRIISYKDGRFSVSVPERFREVSNILYDLKQQGILKIDRGGFGDGRQGLALTDTYGLFIGSYFSQLDPDDLGIVLPPKYDTESEHIVTSPIVGWGVAENAPNRQAVGLFMSEFLDMYDIHPSHRFVSEEARSFFAMITEEYKDKVVYLYEAETFDGQSLSLSYTEKWSTADPDEYLDNIETDLVPICNQANEMISDLS